MGRTIRMGIAQGAEALRLGERVRKSLQPSVPVNCQSFDFPLASLANGDADLLVCRADHLQEMNPDWELAAVLKREETREVLLAGEESIQLENFARSLRIGVEDARQEAFLKRYFTHLEISRMSEVLDPEHLPFLQGSVDGILVSQAVAKRLELGAWVTQRCNPHAFPAAPGQGLVLLLKRKGWQFEGTWPETLHHLISAVSWECEWSFRQTLTDHHWPHPHFGLATVVNKTLSFMGGWISADGTRMEKIAIDGLATEAKDIGKKAAQRVMVGVSEAPKPSAAG
jgi:hydroxymethylbilane synthase